MKTKWTMDNVKSLKGKTYVVTGGNSGLGYETVKALVDKGAHVIMASRNTKRSNQAKKTILKSTDNGSIMSIKLDLASLSSIKKAAEEILQKTDKIDGLINNAGVMFTSFKQTEDGFEYQNGVNHIGHFVLTKYLFNRLKETKGSRIVSVSSLAHNFGKFKPETYMKDTLKSYSKSRSYGLSKLSNLLFTYELSRRLNNQNIDMLAVAAHPGISDTRLTRNATNFFKKIFYFFSQPANKGALPTLRALLDENVKSGDYYGPSGLFELRGYPVHAKVRKKAHNKESAQQLWLLSEQLSNEVFNLIEETHS
jgi:NAD(P)-dependent dehydrogenase (short-subunit alcohol dehydrogenase family)